MTCEYRPAACFCCPHPDCICDDPPNELEERLSQYIDRDPEKVEAEQAATYRSQKRRRDYYQRNKVRIAARQKASREANRETRKAQQRLWYQRNKERLLAEQRAKRRKAG